MPQLLSRRDDTGWLTPSMADILKQGTAPLLSEDLIRSQVSEIQQILVEQETPARIIDIRPSPSHILYVARPEIIGRRSNRRPVTPAEIRRSLAVIAEKHSNWTLGFLNHAQGDDESVGILLRTEVHQPLKLRQLLVSNTFLAHPSTLALVIGVTVEQQMILRDLQQLKHITVIGPDSGRRHLIRELVLTLILFNSPAEIRIAMLGDSIRMFEDLAQSPHTLGRQINDVEQGMRLLDGMLKEAERRRQFLADRQAENFEDYNALMLRQGEATLPRLLILFDSLSDADWQQAAERWMQPLYDLLVNGPRVGIHLALTANHPADLPEMISSALETRVQLRSVSTELAEGLKQFHSTALRFVDGFILSGREITPVEFCTVTDDEVQRLTNYWRQMAAQRTQDPKLVQKRSGVTDLLPQFGDAEPAARPAAPLPTRTRVGTLARATQALSSGEEDRVLNQAQALAAYLGWIGVGPLRDVLGLSVGEARAVMTVLQNMGVVEEGSLPALRFIRLAENPLPPGEDSA